MTQLPRKPLKAAGNTNRWRTWYKRRRSYRLGPVQYPTIDIPSKPYTPKRQP